MPKVNEIRTALFEAAPEYMKMEWDNVGLMCGHAAQEVTRVLVELDASYRVLNEAKAAHCELVVCHHPLIFGGTKTVTDETPVGRSLLFAIENGISVLSFHTNLDCAPEGVNDVLARSLGLSEVTVMEPAGTDEQGRAYGLIGDGCSQLCGAGQTGARLRGTALCGRRTACPPRRGRRRQLRRCDRRCTGAWVRYARDGRPQVPRICRRALSRNQPDRRGPFPDGKPGLRAAGGASARRIPGADRASVAKSPRRDAFSVKTVDFHRIPVINW